MTVAAGRNRARVLAAAAAAVSVVACVDRLPAQDLRILSAVPIERLSVSLLWDDYQKDSAATGRKYRAQAVVVTGTPPITPGSGAGGHFLRFELGKPRDGAVQAYLLDEQADALSTSAKGAERVSLKCFVEGPEGRDIVLRSCVAP